MNKTIIDSSAWIEYLNGTEKGEKIRSILELEQEIYTLPLTIAEIVSRTVRSKNNPEQIIHSIQSMSRIISDSEIATTAGEIHGKTKVNNQKFSLVDAFIVAAAKKLNATIITCDNDFREFKEAKVI